MFQINSMFFLKLKNSPKKILYAKKTKYTADYMRSVLRFSPVHGYIFAILLVANEEPTFN